MKSANDPQPDLAVMRSERAAAEALSQKEIARQNDILREERKKALASEAAAKAQRDAEAAVERERQRVAAAEAAEASAQVKREANKKHVAKVNAEVTQALMACTLTKAEATAVLSALVAGSIPYVTITY